MIAPTLLWSTNTYLKYLIQKTYRADKHFVWCSPVFEGAAMPKYAIGAGQPASSDPASIYRTLHHAVKTSDKGDQKIAGQKKTFRALAVNWEKDGSITTDQRDDIFAMLKHSELTDFRPLIYVIPFPPVAARVITVPRPKRASHHPEFIIPDLDVSEFQIVEPIPCP